MFFTFFCHARILSISLTLTSWCFPESCKKLLLMDISMLGSDQKKSYCTAFSRNVLLGAYRRYIHNKICVPGVRRIRVETDDLIGHTDGEIIKTFNSSDRLSRLCRIDNGKETPLLGRNGITNPQVVGAEDIASSPLTIIFAGKRIHKSFGPNTVVKVESFWMGQVSQTHFYIAESIVNRESAFIKVKWLLR